MGSALGLTGLDDEQDGESALGLTGLDDEQDVGPALRPAESRRYDQLLIYSCSIQEPRPVPFPVQFFNPMFCFSLVLWCVVAMKA